MIFLGTINIVVNRQFFGKFHFLMTSILANASEISGYELYALLNIINFSIYRWLNTLFT